MLLGAFAVVCTIIGSGFAIKESITINSNDEISHAKAKAAGKKIYIGGDSKMRSVKTRNLCILKYHELNRHHVWIDTKTQEIIYDQTAEQNNLLTEKSKDESHKKGHVFYKTYKFNDIHKEYDIWVNDMFPGKYFINVGFRFIEVEIKTEIKSNGSLSYIEYNIIYPQDNYSNSYFIDGTAWTKEENDIRRYEYELKHNIECAKKSGVAFYKIPDTFTYKRLNDNSETIYVDCPNECCTVIKIEDREWHKYGCYYSVRKNAKKYDYRTGLEK